MAGIGDDEHVLIVPRDLDRSTEIYFPENMSDAPEFMPAIASSASSPPRAAPHSRGAVEHTLGHSGKIATATTTAAPRDSPLVDPDEQEYMVGGTTTANPERLCTRRV